MNLGLPCGISCASIRQVTLSGMVVIARNDSTTTDNNETEIEASRNGADIRGKNH